MKINEVRYTKRFNMGNYEHEEFTISAILEGDDTCLDVVNTMKTEIEIARGTVPVLQAAKKQKPVEKEEEPTEEAEPTMPIAAKTAKKAAKKTKAKPVQVYERANDTHKEIFSQMLNRVYPSWKTSAESKNAAKQASQALNGVEFLDENGVVLESFQEKVQEILGN
jgi:hypothetical protein